MGDVPSPTDLELFARVESEAPGTFRLISAVNAGIEERIQQHLRALDDIHELIQRSVAGGFHIEAISLRLQVVDYWLRIYLTNRDPRVTRRREFGALLEQCHELGLEDSIHDKMKEANARRIDAIHGIVVGSIAYEALAPVVAEFGELVKETVVFVTGNCGTVVTHRDQLVANPGASVVHIHSFCREVISGVRY
jgi:hypothetical protein